MSLSLRRTERCTTQEIQFICLCKMSSFAPHVCSWSHSREELIVVFIHESGGCFLSQSHDQIFQMQRILDLTSEFQKAEHRRNYLCRLILFISQHHDILVRAWVLNSHTGCDSTVHFKCSENSVIWIYKRIQFVSLSDSPERLKQTANAHWQQFLSNTKVGTCRLILNSVVARLWRSGMSSGSPGSAQTQDNVA